MIRQRIKDERFDDVTPPPENEQPSGDGEQTVLSQERDRTGLGELYAEEFLAKSMLTQPSGKTKREEETSIELKNLFHKICRQLDSLSHFHFAPRAVVMEGSVTTSGLPSISLEELLPTAESSASLSAPENTLAKKRGREAALLSEAELTSDDKKRLRQASKAVRRKQRHEEDSSEKLASQSGKGSRKFESKKLDETLRLDKRVLQSTAQDPSHASYAKSANFFANLQRQAFEGISDKSSKTKNALKVTASTTSSRTFKL